MYLSDRDIKWAIARKTLIIEPPTGIEGPKIDPTSIDLRLDSVDEAKIWDIAAIMEERGAAGNEEAEVHLGTFKYGKFSEKYLITPPDYVRARLTDKVCKRAGEVLVRPGGFLLWQTKEKVGTPRNGPLYICFVDGKSTRSRTGLLVHLTAPTIHAGWSGNIVLEIANLGPFTFVLQEDDVIAQLTVAMISSCPEQSHTQAGSATLGQTHVTGQPASRRRRGRTSS